ncbi:glycosyltransferase family 39 protein [Tenacibaculum sp. 190524A02b]|uniref:ArnT family glycosyltransferase n=1 Tax=Tenacibaculum vairaonense TaxID=3137860 RepID=UPI0031FBA05C
MKYSYRTTVYIVIILSTVLRLFLGGQLEFGNDEVYYWLYAKYPDISHFDHPPFVGFFIQFFTLDLFFDSELAIRLAAIIPASINMYVLFLIGKLIKNELTGLITVLLYNINIYALIISGTFILPDAPLLFFWLLSFYFLLQSLPYTASSKTKKYMLVAFACIGCAIYSKYQGVYLLFGIGLYVLLVNRKWLKEWSFYLGFLFPILALSLIYYWNYSNDFISYKFHNNRVSLFSLSFNKDSFLREVLGQFIYNNPYIFVMVIIMIVALIKKKFQFEKKLLWMFLFFSFPLIFTTIYLSLFRDTLPHWSGIAYVTLLPFLAVFISDKKNIHQKLMKGFAFFSVLLILVSIEINKGWFLPVNNNQQEKTKVGKKDAIMDLYGWEQASQKVSHYLRDNKLTELPIISDKWFPASHIDYYIARPNNMHVYGVGELPSIHKYYWINSLRPSIENKKEFLYITDGRNYREPSRVYKDNFDKYNLLQTFPITRNEKTVKFVFVYRLTKL